LVSAISTPHLLIKLFLGLYDDLRAGNILLGGSNRVAVIIDWELPNATSPQFSLRPLDIWDDGIDYWVIFYVPYMRIGRQLFRRLKAAAESTERAMEAPLSTSMRENWEIARSG
jgi:aminoglycoside phosphotransferase (APT) family kinase protein